jgi:hypothetical protein
MKLADEIKLKAELLVEGVSASPEALEGLGTLYKEQNHGLFGWDFEDHPGELLPDDFELPNGTIVQFRKNAQSPYIVQRRNGHLAVTKNEKDLCEARWLSRPTYYQRSTSDGTEMRRVCQIGGADSFFLCYNNYCVHWRDNEQCLFCNLVPTSSTYRNAIGRKRLDQIAETIRAAFEEGSAAHVLMTGGCFPGEKETDIVVQIIEAMKKGLGKDHVPGCLLPSPPPDLSDLERIRDAGISGVGYSMEIWDPPLFAAICPGKARSPGRECFLTTLLRAVEVFGPGNAYAVFVSGLEPMDSLLEGVRFLAEHGIASLPFVWSPVPGSKLYRHRAPTADWYVELNDAVASIYAECGLPDTGVHCYRCDGNSLVHDLVRLKQSRGLPIASGDHAVLT